MLLILLNKQYKTEKNKDLISLFTPAPVVFIWDSAKKQLYIHLVKKIYSLINITLISKIEKLLDFQFNLWKQAKSFSIVKLKY